MCSRQLEEEVPSTYLRSLLLHLNVYVLIKTAGQLTWEKIQFFDFEKKRIKIVNMECPNKVKVVLGAQWGDEGKGKLVDLLAEHADVVARCQVSKQFFYPNNITLQKCEVYALWSANTRAFIWEK